MRIMGYTKARVGQPFNLSARKLRKITTPTLGFLGGNDGLVGDVVPAERRAQRYIAGCEIEVLAERRPRYERRRARVRP
jgi:hypothetical protein